MTARDYELVLDVIRVIGEVTDPADLAFVLAQQVARVVQSDVISVNDVDPPAGIFSFVVQPASFTPPESSVKALEELLGEHPMISHTQRTGDGSARKISDFWSPDVWHSSRLYERVYGPMGVEHQMSIALPAPRPAVLGVALSRHRVDFSERDRAALNRLRPHMSQTWRQSREHAQVQTLLGSAASALTASKTGVLLLSDPIHELTPGALTELYRFFGRPPAHSAIPHRVQHWAELEGSKCRDLDVSAFAKPLSVTRDGQRLVLRYLPARSSHPATVLMRRTPPEDVSAQLALLGLSPRETDVLSELTRGSTNAEIGFKLHLAPATVKKYLDNIYLKLGANGRVQATAIALSSAVVSHDSEP